MRKTIYIILLSFILMLAGCSEVDETSIKLEKLESRLIELENDNIDLNKKLNDFEEMNNMNEQEITELKLNLESVMDNYAVEEDIISLEETLTMVINYVDYLLDEEMYESLTTFALNELLITFISELLTELEKLPEWDPESEILSTDDLLYFFDETYMNSRFQATYDYTYRGEIKGVRLYTAEVNGPICTLGIVSPTILEGGYWIPGGSNGCYTKRLAVIGNNVYELNGYSPTSPEEIGLTPEEVCSLEGVCLPFPDVD